MFDISRWPWRPDRYTLTAVSILIVTFSALDTPIALMAAGFSPRVERIGRVVTTFGLSGYMFFLSAAIAASALWLRGRTDDRQRRVELALIAERSTFFFAAIGVSGLLVQIIKHVVGRTRPSQLLEVGAFHFEPFSTANTYASFPSGHTTTAFSAAVALSLIAPWARPFWFAAAILIGLSRVVVHAHYPTDVIAGAVLGTLTALGVARWFANRAIAFDPAVEPLRIKTARVGSGP